MPLSGFMRRLLLQVLLEDDKITVSVRNSSTCTSSSPEEDTPTSYTLTDLFPLSSTGSSQMFHPRYGSGRGCQCITMPLSAKCSDVVIKIADCLPLANMWTERQDKKKESSSLKKKDVLGEIGTTDLDVLFMTHLSQTAGEISHLAFIIIVYVDLSKEK